MVEVAWADFQVELADAIAREIEIDLTGRTLVLEKAVRLRARQRLAIRGGTIQGACHSLFQIDEHRRMGTAPFDDRDVTGDPSWTLRLRGVRLVHTCVNEDPRQVGACLFVMGRSGVLLERCALSSTEGFGVWSKHQGHIVLRECIISDVGRTGIAGFNESRLVATGCDILRAGVHGVCIRHTTSAELIDVRIADSRARGVYAYQKARMSMLRCVVTGTLEATPAVQVSALEPGDSVDFKMEGCHIHSNLGLGLHIEGCVVLSHDPLEAVFRNVLDGVLIRIAARDGEASVVMHAVPKSELLG
jgi:hypothetical protein